MALQRPEQVFQCLNPVRPTDIVAATGYSKELVQEVVEGMRDAQPRFRSLTLEQRLAQLGRVVSFLRENADEIKSQMRLELGRSRDAVEAEWGLCDALFDGFPAFAKTQLSPREESSGTYSDTAPVGCVLVSTNAALPVYSFLAALLPALVAGNAVCLRPSLHAPLSASLLINAFHQAELPPGLVQLVYGDMEVFRRLLLTQKFQTVLCSAGEETLEQLRRDVSSQQETTLVLASGGKNAAIVCASAQLEHAVERVLYGATVDCGQRLESTSLVFVEEGVRERFTDLLVAAVRAMPIGAREDLATAQGHIMGPLCSERAFDRFLRFQGIAAREAQDTLRWGKGIDNAGNGFFVSPGVHAMRPERIATSVYASNAFFGPDLCIVPVDDAAQAIATLDPLRAARAVSVFSSRQEDAQRVRDLTDTPAVLWNETTTYLDPRLPAVGRGHAGNGAVTGMHFLFSTLFRRTFRAAAASAKAPLLASLFLCGLYASLPERALAAAYERAVEGADVVKGKLYPRAGKFQVNFAQGGLVLNQSFLDTYLINGGATYHFNEWHAVNVEGFFGISADRDARQCVESFYFDTARAKRYDPNFVPCNPAKRTASGLGATYQLPAGQTEPVPTEYAGSADKLARFEESKKRGGPLHRKPAYMPIRQVDYMFGVNYQYTPVYGKALFFLSSVGYLDFFVNGGLGLAMSTYWPKKDKNSRGEDIKLAGTSGDAEYGFEGRPAAQSQTSPTLQLGLGTRFFFLKNFLVNAELRNVSIVGSDGLGGTEFNNFFALYGGAGIMF